MRNITLLFLYKNNKKINFNFNNLNYFLLIIKFFKNLINYLCNFYISLKLFFIEFFYYIGFVSININIKLYIITLYNYFNLKFLNTIFNLFINNYYSIDFYTKNSKIMSFSALKKFIIYKF